jgi:aspartyl-tRNA(Asn)/glutamyl-tRNA(Gln) amidotransferase subunit A
VSTPATGLAALSAGDLVAGFAAGEFTPAEALAACTARIAEVEPEAHAFVALDPAGPARAAEAATRAYAEGRARPLEGVPVGVKDMFDVAGLPATYGSPMFREHVPARDAEAVRRLREAGAVIVGKTVTHEFAWGITTANRHFPECRNPWNPTRVTGGSSGGSAVALALHEVPLALGSDTGGSIRIPSAFCGVAGLKPTYGRVSGAGGFPLTRSLDHPGPMARTVADLRRFLGVIAGVDPADPATVDVPLGLDGAAGDDLRGVRVALCDDLMLVELAPDVDRAWRRAVAAVEALGAEVVEVTCPSAASIYPTFGVLQRAEALRVHQRAGLYPERRAEYGADVLGRLELAEDVTLTEYLDACSERAVIEADMRALFGAADVLLTPVSAGSPVVYGEEAVEHLGASVPFRDVVMPYTVPQDLTGLPTCALRAGTDDLGIPVAVQVTGPAWAEGRVLDVAERLEAALAR